MEQKIKFVIIGIIAILIISLSINLETYTTKKNIQRERDGLKQDNATLTQKVEESLKENQKLQENIDKLNTDLDKMLQEKEEIQKRYDLLSKERDEAIEKIKTLPTTAAVKESTPIISDTYWSGVLKTKTDLESQMENLRSGLKTLKINNEQLQRDKSALELELSSLTQEKQGLEQELGYREKMFDNITSERILETNTKRQVQDRFNSLKNENAILKRQLKILSQQKVNLETKLQHTQEEKAAFERRFNEMSSLLEERLSQIGDLRQRLDTVRSGDQTEMPLPRKEAIELPPIVVYPQKTGKTPVPEEKASEFTSQAKILAVNKENNFVIIDLGQDAGIKIGDTFQVYSEGKSIATIAVIQVRRGIAACDIKREEAPIKVGDIVK